MPTLIWYVTLFFTGTHSPYATVFMAIGVTGLFALSALLYGLGEMVKTALGALFMACAGVLWGSNPRISSLCGVHIDNLPLHRQICSLDVDAVLRRVTAGFLYGSRALSPENSFAPGDGVSNVSEPLKRPGPTPNQGAPPA